MGFASGGEVFNKVADKLLEIKAPDDVVIEVIAALTDGLTDLDWDTLDESVSEYLGSPAILEGMRKGAPHWFENDDEWDGDDDA